MKMTAPHDDRNRTVRNVANSVTVFALTALVGVVLMLVFDVQELFFGIGAAFAIGALLFILLEARIALAPIGMIALESLRCERECLYQEQEASQPQKPKPAPLKLVVSRGEFPSPGQTALVLRKCRSPKRGD